MSDHILYDSEGVETSMSCDQGQLVQSCRAAVIALIPMVTVVGCSESVGPTDLGDSDNPSEDSGSGSITSDKLVFSSDREDDNPEIYIMVGDSTDITRVTNHLDSDGQPAWSPDGNTIAFTSTRDGNSEIYTVQADGSELTRLTNNSARDYEPAWSPDGSQIAFESSRVSTNTQPDIFVMDADGSNVVRVTSVNGKDPTWSPDGSRIAYSSGRQNPDPFLDGYHYYIYTINSDGTDERRITSVDYSDVEPSWSPNGKQVAYQSESSGSGFGWDIYVTNVDGSGERNLVVEGGTSPTWGPDTAQVTFSSTSNIYSVNVDRSGGLIKITGSSGGGDPDWWTSSP